MSESKNYGGRFIDGLSDRDSRTKDYHLDESLGEGLSYLAGNCVLSTGITIASVIGLILGGCAWNVISKKIDARHASKKNDSDTTVDE